MQFIKTRFNYLFGSTKGLILVAIAMIAVVTAIWGMLSGPMAEMGVREIVIKLFGMDIVQAEREGRIIILYHSIAMAVVAIETYMVTGILKMKEFFKMTVRLLITVGYILTMVFGMGFAYFGHNWAFHGLYITGLSLIFFAGVLLCIALWPWDNEYYITDTDYARTKKGVDLVLHHCRDNRHFCSLRRGTWFILRQWLRDLSCREHHPPAAQNNDGIFHHRSPAHHAGADRHYAHAHYRSLVEL